MTDKQIFERLMGMGYSVEQSLTYMSSKGNPNKSRAKTGATVKAINEYNRLQPSHGQAKAIEVIAHDCNIPKVQIQSILGTELRKVKSRLTVPYARRDRGNLK
jgi:hypothetical protein